MYADILLPLAVTGSYTYFVPPTLAQRVAVGSRVVVPLGQRKHYTGIVVRLHEKEPAEGVLTLKITSRLLPSCSSNFGSGLHNIIYVQQVR